MSPNRPFPATSFTRAIAATLLALALLPGCSHRAWYEGMRASAESECRKLPPGGYEDCMARVNRQSYEDYEQERERRKRSTQPSP